MVRRSKAAPWARSIEKSLSALVRNNLRVGAKIARSVPRTALGKSRPPPGDGDWIAGLAMGSSGARRYRLYRPPGLLPGERLPLLVMLHGCGQDANDFAASTRMNRIAQQQRFLVLYPEQDRLANAQGCWNWFDTRNGRAAGEVALILKAVQQVCLLYSADRDRVAVAGLSAGASMAALMVTHAPDRFKAVVMHSGVPPGTAHSTASALGAMHGRRGTEPLAATAAAMAASWPPLMVIHGSADRVVSRSNGEAAVRIWADAAQASAGASRSVRRGRRYPMTMTDYRQDGKVVASHVEIETLDHAWSGGAARRPYGDAAGPDASRLVWAFVSRQFA